MALATTESAMAERWLAMHASTNSRVQRPAQENSHYSGLLDQEDSHRTPASLHRRATARSSQLEGQVPLSDMSPGRSERAFRTGNERLYEAYNDLHALAQDFEKPFDAPAILVVGHQTDGKSGGSVGMGWVGCGPRWLGPLAQSPWLAGLEGRRGMAFSTRTVPCMS